MMNEILSDALAELGDNKISSAVEEGFKRSAHSLSVIERTFALLTSHVWSQKTLQTFFNAWRDTHLSSGSVSAIVCRLLEASGSRSPGAYCFVESARSIAQVIHEDLGMCGETHSILFERLANSICLDDEWKLNKHRVPTACEFRNWVHKKRVDGTLDQSIFLTIASEIYNHCEYSFIAPLFKNWMQNLLGFERERIPSNMAYILVHTGATEHNHFLHGLNALLDYYSGVDRLLKYSDITDSIVEYLSQLECAYEEIYSRLIAESLELEISQPVISTNNFYSFPMR